MNKTFTRLFAGALAAASLFALASCGEKKDGDDKSANAATPAPAAEAPTAAPTEAPTPEPTPIPEPTATPVPEGWIIDPRGIIPLEVEIIWHNGHGSCIAKVDGNYAIQCWGESKIIPNEQWFVPKELIEILEEHKAFLEYEQTETSIWIYSPKRNAIFLTASYDKSGARLTFSPGVFYYQGADGKELLLEANSLFVGNSYHVMLGTEDGKAIKYKMGDAFYEMHDFGSRMQEFGSDAQVVVHTGNYTFEVLAGRHLVADIDLETLEWEKVYLSDISR